MINEKNLIKLSLIMCVLGIILLMIISKNITLMDVDLLEEGDSMITLNGRVLDVKESEKVAYLTIVREVPTEILLFKDNNLSIPIGIYVTIEAEMDDDGFIGHEILIKPKQQ